MAAAEGWKDLEVNPRAGLSKERRNGGPAGLWSGGEAPVWLLFLPFLSRPPSGSFLGSVSTSWRGSGFFSDLRLRWVETRQLRSRPIETELLVTPLSAPTEAGFLIDLSAAGPLCSSLFVSPSTPLCSLSGGSTLLVPLNRLQTDPSPLSPECSHLPSCFSLSRRSERSSLDARLFR